MCITKFSSWLLELIEGLNVLQALWTRRIHDLNNLGRKARADGVKGILQNQEGTLGNGFYHVYTSVSTHVKVVPDHAGRESAGVMSKYILLVDDDALMRRSLAMILEQAGYRTSTAANAEDALASARRDRPDLVLLDIGLPGMDGLDALRHFKDQLGVSVIFLTARRRNLDQILGLELGADDYITKPFEADVLLAHIKAVLRRISAPQAVLEQAALVTVGDIQIDPYAHTVTVGGRPVELTPREFDLLHTLALESNRVIAVDELLDRVWGAEFIGQPQVVYVHIRWLREKIETDPGHPQRILSVHGVGYKLTPKDT